MEGFALPPGLGNVQLLQVNTTNAAANTLTHNQQVPQAIANLPTGTILKGFVVSRDQQNNPVLRTPRGDVAVKSDVFLKTGSEIELRISVQQARVQAKIMTIDDIPIKEFAAQQQAKSASGDTVMQPSMLKSSAPTPAPTMSGGNVSTPAPATTGAAANAATSTQPSTSSAPTIEASLLQPANYGDAKQTRQTMASILQTAPATLPPMEKDTVLQFRIVQAATLPAASNAPASSSSTAQAFQGPSYSASVARTGNPLPPATAAVPTSTTAAPAPTPSTPPSPPGLGSGLTATPSIPTAPAASATATPPLTPTAPPPSTSTAAPLPPTTPATAAPPATAPSPAAPLAPSLSSNPAAAAFPSAAAPSVSTAAPPVTAEMPMPIPPTDMAAANKLAAQSQLSRLTAPPATDAAAPPPPSAPAAAVNTRPGTVTATIIGHEPGGTSIARTALGTLRLQTATPPPVGSQMQLEWVPMQVFTGTSYTPERGILFAEPTLPVTTDPLQVAGRLSHHWQSLDDSLQLLQQEAPQFARELMQRLPNTRSGLVNSVLFFVSAMKGGDIRRWLGNPAVNALDDSKPSLLARLTGDFASMARVQQDTPDSNWNMLMFPLVNEDELHQLRLYVREDANSENKQESGTRFVMDVSLSELGEIQLDGWIHTLSGKKQFDLVMRSERELVDPIPDELQQLFIASLEAVGYTGSLRFQTGFKHYVKPLQDIAHPPGSGETGSILA